MAETLNTRDDADLVVLALAGDRAAFGALYERHRPLLRGLCRRALGDAALVDDAMQEAALQALLNLASLRQPERFGAWLGGIGLNVCRALLRRRGKADWSWEAIVGGRAAWEPVDGAPSPCQAVEAAELRTAVRLAVAGLPRGQRAAVLLFYLRGLTYAEAAAALRIEVGAVRTRLHKARRSLRTVLMEIGLEDVMTTETQTAFVRVRVRDVRGKNHEAGDPNWQSAQVVVLQEIDGERVLPIWVGPHEGTAIALLLEHIQPPRPLTYRFAADLLAASGAKLHEVRITRLAADTFYAVTVIDGGAGQREVDARPSDAIALALSMDAPIAVEAAIFSQAAASRDRFEAAAQPAGNAEWTRHAGEIAQDAQRAWTERRQPQTGAKPVK